MSLTLSAIFTAPSLYLHIEGDAKRRVLETAIGDPRSRLPIRAFMAQAPVPPRVFWCPDAGGRTRQRWGHGEAPALDALRSTGAA
jgi:6-phosphogluconolactonase